MADILTKRIILYLDRGQVVGPGGEDMTLAVEDMEKPSACLKRGRCASRTRSP